MGREKVCPKCYAEFVEGVNECADCGEKLVDKDPYNNVDLELKRREINEKDEIILDLDPSIINTVAAVLITGAILVVIKNIKLWQNAAIYGPAIIDFILGYNLFKMKSWAKTWILFRAWAGIVLWAAIMIVGLLMTPSLPGIINNAYIFGFNLIYSGGLIYLLTGKYARQRVGIWICIYALIFVGLIF